jgi:hypothetical protein
MKHLIVLVAITVLVCLSLGGGPIFSSDQPSSDTRSPDRRTPERRPPEHNEPLEQYRDLPRAGQEGHLPPQAPKSPHNPPRPQVTDLKPVKPFSLAPDAQKVAALLIKPAPKYDPKVEAAAKNLDFLLDIQTKMPSSKEPDLPLPPPGKFNFLSIVLKIIFAIVIIILLWTIFQHLKSPKLPGKELPEAPKPLIKTLDKIYEQSLNLAKKGRFAEAIHELLLKSLEEFQRQKKTYFPASFTSREILAKLKLGPPVEPALAFIIQKTEISIFGLYTPDESDYQDCQTKFQALLKGLSGSRR